MADDGAMDDLASDMSVYHGIRDIGAMPSHTLARLALRIAVYGGAVGAHIGHAARSLPGVPSPQPPPEPRPSPRRPPPGPPASAAQLAGMLARVPGSQVWGEVRTVKPADQEPPGG